MGKYMKKSKLRADIAVMEMFPHTSHGVRTRAAKTLALQRLSSSPKASSSSYLQLRTRRLHKTPFQKPHHSIHCCRANSNPEILRDTSPLKQDSAYSEPEKQNPGIQVQNDDVIGVKNRNTAENTPCSLVRDSNTLETIWNTMSSKTDSREEVELHRKFSSNSNDIEEFFAYEELWHQRMFIEKYNFDFTNDMPLQGRYEWVQMVE